MIRIGSLSPSSIKRFETQCPMRFKLRKMKVPAIEVDASPRQYGQSIHNIIRDYFLKLPEKKPTEEEIMIMVETAFEEGKTLVMKHRERTTNKIKANFTAFEQQRLKTFIQFKPTFVEKELKAVLFSDLFNSFNYPLPYQIIIDAYWQEDRVGFDWKTGNDSPEAEIIQGSVSEMVLNKLGYPCDSFRFFQLILNTKHQIPEMSPDYIHNISARILYASRTNNFPRKKSGLCGWCEFVLACQLGGRCLWL